MRVSETDRQERAREQVVKNQPDMDRRVAHSEDVFVAQLLRRAELLNHSFQVRLSLDITSPS